MNRTRGAELREKIRKTFWRREDAWTGESEKGFFQAPRTLPLILHLVSKTIDAKGNAARVYLELWARHLGGGVIEMKHEGEHAYGAGYVGNRAIRTWREHILLLEKHGFIKVHGSGNQEFKYVLLMHPTSIVERLRGENKLDKHWLQTYMTRQLETKEEPYEARLKAGKIARKPTAKVVQIKQKSA